MPARRGVMIQAREKWLKVDACYGVPAFVHEFEDCLLVGSVEVAEGVAVVGEPDALIIAGAAGAVVLCLGAMLVGDGEYGTA